MTDSPAGDMRRIRRRNDWRYGSERRVEETPGKFGGRGKNCGVGFDGSPSIDSRGGSDREKKIVIILAIALESR